MISIIFNNSLIHSLWDSLDFINVLVVIFCLFLSTCSEEQVSELTKELDAERERASISEANTTGEASNLSFEMSEADL